jgi:hypothetical protein
MANKGRKAKCHAGWMSHSSAMLRVMFATMAAHSGAMTVANAAWAVTCFFW